MLQKTRYQDKTRFAGLQKLQELGYNGDILLLRTETAHVTIHAIKLNYINFFVHPPTV
jgi:hypothetical protein